MLWPMVLPPYHSLCRRIRGCCFETKNWAEHSPAGTQMRQDPHGGASRGTWQLVAPCLTWAPALADPTVIGGGGDFTLAFWDAACPDISVPLWFSGISIVPWAKSQGISTLPVVCVGHGGEDWASHLLSESQTLPVSGEVDTVCPKTTHLEGCNETLWKDMHEKKKRKEKICMEVLWKH